MTSRITRPRPGSADARRSRGGHQRTLTVFVTMLAIVLGLAGSAQARGYDEGAVDEGGRFYANFDEDRLLFAGGTAADFCGGEEPEHEARVFHRQDGTQVKKVDGSEQPIHLYASELGAPEFLDEHCPNPPAPMASGWGTVTIRQHLAFADGPPLRLKNQTIGTVSDDDGTIWRVRGWADLHFVDGVPEGTPETFQGLQIARVGG